MPFWPKGGNKKKVKYTKPRENVNLHQEGEFKFGVERIRGYMPQLEKNLTEPEASYLAGHVTPTEYLDVRGVPLENAVYGIIKVFTIPHTKRIAVAYSTMFKEENGKRKLLTDEFGRAVFSTRAVVLPLKQYVKEYKANPYLVLAKKYPELKHIFQRKGGRYGEPSKKLMDAVNLASEGKRVIFILKDDKQIDPILFKALQKLPPEKRANVRIYNFAADPEDTKVNANLIIVPYTIRRYGMITNGQIITEYED